MKTRQGKSFIDIADKGGFVKAELCVPKGSMLARQLEAMEGQCESFGYPYRMLRKASRECAFLTVVIRTQGKRMELLNETFLCLLAQTDQDFNVIVVCHNPIDGGVEMVEGLVSAFEDDFADRVSIAEAHGGDRSRPLNVGFWEASTDYVVALDDDDIVFDNWVETFHEASGANGGQCIVHSYVYTQLWEQAESDFGPVARAIDSPNPQFDKDFDYLLQVSRNVCPIMSLAFPTAATRLYGLLFDETLSTTEDWDFLMRACQRFDVVETGEFTSIYRLWKSGETSGTLHSQLEWDMNKFRVQDKMCSGPFVIPGRDLDRILGRIDEDVDTPVRSGVEVKAFLRLSDGTVTEQSLDTMFDMETRLNETFVKTPDDVAVESISFEPTQNGPVTISDFTLYCRKGDRVDVYDSFDVHTNGTRLPNGDIALIRKPLYIEVVFDRPVVPDDLLITYKFTNRVDREVIGGTKIVIMSKFAASKVRRRLGGAGRNK